ncbi:hypothetical protein [Rhodopirellula bahusiensis]|uniref:hypothetical protein n=1 Tax=Rhodopirellula bahusiensis TaxID=2014065 RepID=UPI003262F1B0
MPFRDSSGGRFGAGMIRSPDNPSSIVGIGFGNPWSSSPSAFGIDCLAYTDDEVARRWLQLFPPSPQAGRFTGGAVEARD